MPITVTFGRQHRNCDRFYIRAGTNDYQIEKRMLVVKTGGESVISEADSFEKLLRKAVCLGAKRVSILLQEESEQFFFGELLKAAERIPGALGIDIRIRQREDAEPSGIKNIGFSPASWQCLSGDEVDRVAAVLSRLSGGNQWNDSFRGRLFQLVDERGMSDSQVYQKANMDRRLYSKIRCGQNYHPRKRTILALAIALELNLEETIDLLSCAGRALSVNDQTDRIFISFVSRKIYSLIEINQVLFACHLPLLGGTVHEKKANEKGRL